MTAVRWFFGARGQLAVGIVVWVISVLFWAIGAATVPGVAAAPWHWTTGAYIFHASMLALVLAAYAIVATALNYKATERVEAQVADVEIDADKVEVT